MSEASAHQACIRHLRCWRLPLSTSAGLIEQLVPPPQERRIKFTQRPPLAYDVLSIDIGITPAQSSVPGAAQHTTPVKPIDGCVAPSCSLACMHAGGCVCCVPVQQRRGSCDSLLPCCGLAVACLQWMLQLLWPPRLACAYMHSNCWGHCRFVARLDRLLERCRAWQRPLALAVVGGGAGGVELALALQHRLRQERLAAGQPQDMAARVT